MRYEVIARYSEIVEVEADNEDEAISKAQDEIDKMNMIMSIADEYEVECLDEED